jgi:hypothetical protein
MCDSLARTAMIWSAWAVAFNPSVFHSGGRHSILQRMKLWGGRFTGEADAEFARFNSSFSFDRRLIEADIEGSRAHAEALLAAGILNEGEAQDRLGTQ